MAQAFTMFPTVSGEYLKTFVRHKNLPFNTPMHLSIQFLPCICAWVYLYLGVSGNEFTIGVINQGSCGYPESPNNQVFLSPIKQKENHILKNWYTKYQYLFSSMVISFQLRSYCWVSPDERIMCSSSISGVNV